MKKQQKYEIEYLKSLIQIKEKKEEKIIESVDFGKLDIYPFIDPQSASFKLQVASTQKVCAMLKLESLTGKTLI